MADAKPKNDRAALEHVVRSKIRDRLSPQPMDAKVRWWVASSKLRDAVQIYTSSLISETIGAIALLPADDEFKRLIGDAADLIAHARACGVSVDGLMVMVMEADDA